MANLYPFSYSGKVDPQGRLQIHILGPQPDERSQEKPLVAAVPGRKRRVDQHNGHDDFLQLRLVLGQQYDFARQQQYGKPGQPQPRHPAESRQRRLKVGAEYLAQNKQ